MCNVRRFGFTLVELLVVIAIIGILIAMLIPAVQYARESGRRAHCSNNMHQLAIAVKAYITTYQGYPVGRFRNSNSQRWSQHARLLPYLEAENIADRIDYTKGPGNAANKKARLAQIGVFRCPSDRNRMTTPYSKNHYGWGKNNYKGNAGSQPGTMSGTQEKNDGIFVTNQFVRPAYVTDGESKTAMFAEAVLGDADDQLVEIPSDWFRISESAKTREEVYQACLNVQFLKGPSNQICRSGRNWVWGNYIPTRYNHVMPPNKQSCARRNKTSGNLDCGVNDKGGATTASSRHPGGTNVLMAGGELHFISDGIDVKTWWALGSRNGRDVVRGVFD